MVGTPERPIGRMTVRKNATGAPRRIRLWDLSPEPNSTAEGLLKIYMGALAGIDRLEGKKSELAQSPELTPIGVQRGAVDFAFREIVPTFEKGKLAITQARQEVAGRRAKLAPPKSDPTDMAAALRRQEIRTMLRGMDTKGRDAFLKQAGKFTGMDPEVRMALVEMPASMSGITDGFRDGLLNEAMQSAYGPELDQISELERAIEICASALGETSEEVRREAIEVDAGFADPDIYAARSKQAAGLSDALWLKKFQEGGLEVIRAMKQNSEGQTIWATANDDDIANGLLADSRNEFDKLKSAAPPFSTGDKDADRTARAAFVDEHGLQAYLDRNKLEGSSI
jgi:hypothetical protein